TTAGEPRCRASFKPVSAASIRALAAATSVWATSDARRLPRPSISNCNCRTLSWAAAASSLGGVCFPGEALQRSVPPLLPYESEARERRFFLDEGQVGRLPARLERRE